MQEFLKIIDKMLELDVTNCKCIRDGFNDLWTKMYLYEKAHPTLSKKIDALDYEEKNRLQWKLASLEEANYFYLEQDPLICNNIIYLDNLENKILNKKQIEQLLSMLVQDGRKFLIEQYQNEDIEHSSLLGHCINVSEYLNKKYLKSFNVYSLRTDNLYGPVSPHQFNMIEIDSTEGVKNYVIDLTYRQFFLISRCNPYRIYHFIENSIMPGYFFKDRNLAKDLLYKGYFEIDEYTAKIYSDSFLLANMTMENVMSKKMTIETDTNYTPKQYVKSLTDGIKIRH